MANVSIIGSIKEFESSHDNWLTYKRRIDAWLRVNKIEEEQKVDVLIALVGSEAVDLLVSLCTPNDITTTSYEDLTAMLTRHYGCGESEVISSYQFDTRDQAETETVSEYIVVLKKLSINCAFGDKNQLNKKLRNRLVVGVKEDAISNRLLAEHDLSWKRACEVAIQMDMARYGSKLIHAQSSGNVVKQHKSQQQHCLVNQNLLRTSTPIKNATVAMVSIQQMHAGSRMRNASIVPRSGTYQRPVAIRETRRQSFAVITNRNVVVEQIKSPTMMMKHCTE